MGVPTAINKVSQFVSSGHEATHNVMTPFVEAISTPALRDRLAEMCRMDTTTQVLSWLMGIERFLIWAHCIGVATDAELRAAVSAVPPRGLRELNAAPEEEIFLWTGLVDLQNFFELQRRFGTSPNGRKLRVLDFACGCGRLSRYLAMHPEVDAYGSDVNPEMVAWCRAELPGVMTLVNAVSPPMQVPSDFFDLVFSLSLFSHLPERRASEWLADIARVMLPGGLLIATVHGLPAMEIIRGSRAHQAMFGLNEEEIGALMERLPQEGLIFRPYDPNTLISAKVGAVYGNTFTHTEYIARTWNTDRLEVVEHIAGGLRGWQDCVVLRRR